ncbi:MAG: hypothetical protein JKX84_06740 [Flavobacteriales bacterium]|nr:hypothetical protein [Flavobacteriales bacterium]
MSEEEKPMETKKDVLPKQKTEEKEPDGLAYLLQEANVIGVRIQWYLEQHEKIENLGLLSTGAVWAFIMSHSWNESIKFIAWIPLIASVLLFIKSLLFTKTIGEAFDYLHGVEEQFNLPTGKGWVHSFRAKSSKYKRKWRKFFWLFLIAINLLIPLFFPFELILKTVTKQP